MAYVLADCVGPVVAGNAIADNIGVIKNGGCPGGGVVAVIALFAGGDMRRRLAGGLHAVVARATVSRNRRVVHECNGTPCSGDMAVGTLCRRHDVISRFG